MLTFTKDGYSEGRVQITKSLNAGILVLDILAGLVGVIVDAATGSWYNLNPSDAQVTLTKIGDGDGPAEIQVSVTRDGGTLRIKSSTPGVGVGVARE